VVRIELVGVAEIAELLGGITRQRVHKITVDYPDFPEPVAYLQQGRVWLKRDVLKWIARHPNRRPGKPSTPTKKNRGQG
jgi:hypothetical protein